jgi:predicted short-subunit dehydrogenase-like oxidoreductase (DUF2520 family)
MTAYAAFRDPRPEVTIIGAGAVGRVLAARLADGGYTVRAVVSRTVASAEDAGRSVGATIVSNSLFDVPETARLVFICVPDGEIAAVAERLARVPHVWEKTVVAHTSGALSSSVLLPLAERGARVLSFHPLQTLTRQSRAEALEGVYAGIEGPAQSVATGIELAVGLGMRYLVLTPETKARYHLGASVASNFLVTLLAVAQQILTSLDIDRATAQEIIDPLVRGTIENLRQSTPEDALTGPIVRGDLDTLRQHGLALRRYLPHLVPVYAALAMETVPLAVRTSRLDPDRADAILEMLAQMVTLPLPTPATEGPAGAPRGA